MSSLPQALYPVLRGNERQNPDSKTLVDDHDLAFGHGFIVHEQIHGFAGHTIKFDNGTGREFEDTLYGKAGLAQFYTDVQIDIEHPRLRLS